MNEARPRPRGRLIAILAGIAVIGLAVALAPYWKEIIHHYGLGSLDERLEGRWAPVGKGGQLEARKGIEFLAGGRLVDLAVAKEHSFIVEGDTLLVTVLDEKPPKTLRVPVSWQGSHLVLEIRNEKQHFRRLVPEEE